MVAFAAEHGADRMVYWEDPAVAKFTAPCLYPLYPGLLPDRDRPTVEQLREHMRRAAEMTTAAGMEFGYAFQVLEFPEIDRAPSMSPDGLWQAPELERLHAACPRLFNRHGEPDMAGDFVYQFILDQLDELIELVPGLCGVETYVTEVATAGIATLRHQELPVEEICARIVDTVHDHTARSGREMIVDIHSSGGDPVMRAALLKAAQRHPDIIVSCDNVIGDFHLHLPFNKYLVRAAETNPVQVRFDADGENWGRNFVPTGALDQYAAHLEEARAIGAFCVDARLSTVHDATTPHANVLPSRRRFYPGLAAVDDAKPLPHDLEITVTDALGAFNAEFFLRRARDAEARPEDALREFLRREFGASAERLAPTFMKLEALLGKLFYADKNYYAGQSRPPTPECVRCYALNFHMAYAPGTSFPTGEVLAQTNETTHVAFDEWPTPLGHKCAGPWAMIREKEDALAEATRMLEEVKRVGPQLGPEDRAFLTRQFEDLVRFAEAYRFLLEAQARYFVAAAGRTVEELPDVAGLERVLAELERIAARWEARYPGGRYHLAETLRQWIKIMGAPEPTAV